MNKKKYDSLIDELQGFAQQNPKKYRFRVLMLGVLGYVYIFLVLVLLLLIVAGIIYLMVMSKRGHYLSIKLLLFAGGLAFIVFKSLWIKLYPPEGLRVTRKDAPRLFEMLDQIKDGLKCPGPHVVLINGEYNACIVQNPRLGILGWYKNYLCLGLPLMESLSPDQFKAVLIHEFGHLAGAHGRSGTWIYRIRES